MRIVVTGAAGFVGEALVRQMISNGMDVVAVARRAAPGTVQVIDYRDCPGGDVLVHLAQDSDRARVNSTGSEGEKLALTTLDGLVHLGFRKIIYASSAVLYGDLWAAPRRVGDDISVVDSYTRIKRASEEMVLSCGGGVARLANVYGPGMAATNVISTVLQQLGSTGPMRIRNTSPVRDFIAVDDVSNALMALVDAPQGIFNVGTGIGTSAGELARLFLDVNGESHRIIESGVSDGASSALVLDIAETISITGWRPLIRLREGVRQLIKQHNDQA